MVSRLPPRRLQWCTNCRLQIANIKCQIVGAQPQRDGLAAGCAPFGWSRPLVGVALDPDERSPESQIRADGADCAD
jgi:hypothetical protein